MLGRLKQHFYNHNAEMNATIKLMDVEEKFDLMFSRFFGLYFCQIGCQVEYDPNTNVDGQFDYGHDGRIHAFLSRQLGDCYLGVSIN